jgi:hypothetical protein
VQCEDYEEDHGLHDKQFRALISKCCFDFQTQHAKLLNNKIAGSVVSAAAGQCRLQEIAGLNHVGNARIVKVDQLKCSKFYFLINNLT